MAELLQLPPLPMERRSVPMYRTIPPRNPDRAVAAMAARFGVRGKAQDDGTRLIIDDRRSSLEIFLTSDSLRWSQIGTWKNEDGPAGKVPDELAARKLAERYLRTIRIPLTNASFHGITQTQLSQATSRRKEPVTEPIAVHVNYRHALGDLPILGPGAKLQVTFGGGGKVVECYRFWRECKVEGERPLLSSEQVAGLLRRDPMFADLKAGESRVVFRQATLGYFALPPRELQGMLIPVYALRGTASTPQLERYDFTRYVVAVPFSPEEAKTLGSVFEAAPHLFG